MVLLILIRKKYLQAAVWCALVLLLPWVLRVPTPQPVFSPVTAADPAVIIDPGHGGEDGGAVAADGSAESSINLSIAHRLQEVLLLLGTESAMTREGEGSVASPDAETLREKKRTDLENRVAFVNQHPNAVLLSIHQNSLPSVPSVHGAQAFYGTAQGSAELAELIQECLNRSVNTDKTKNCKAIDPSIYLMKHAKCPAVLLECGFMSNPEEVKLLQEDSHQTRLAISIAAGFLQWQNST